MYKIKYKDENHIKNPLIEYRYPIEYTNDYVLNIDEIKENINKYYKGYITYEELEESINVLDEDRIDMLSKVIFMLYKEKDQELKREIAQNINGLMSRELTVLQYMDDIYKEEYSRSGKKNTYKYEYLEDLKKYLENFIEEDVSIGCYDCGYANYEEMISNSKILFPEREPLWIKLEEAYGKVLSQNEKDILATYLMAIEIIEFELCEQLKDACLREYIKFNTKEAKKYTSSTLNQKKDT